LARNNKREFEEQVALMEWFAIQYPREIVIVSANGGSRHFLEAANLKRSGVRRGVPDLFMPVVNDDYAGLFIELKPTIVAGKSNGRVTDEQFEVLSHLDSRGYKAQVCWGFEDASSTIKQYMLKR